MIEIIIINPENKAPTVVKGDFAFVVAGPKEGEANAVFMGAGSALEISRTLAISCRKTLENIVTGNVLARDVLITAFRSAFNNPNNYARTYKTDSVPKY